MKIYGTAIIAVKTGKRVECVYWFRSREKAEEQTRALQAIADRVSRPVRYETIEKETKT